MHTNFESSTGISLPNYILHSYIRENYFRLWLDQIREEEILGLERKLQGIDAYIENENNIMNFLDDLEYHGDFQRAMVFHCGIEGVSYEGGVYGFFDDGAGTDPALSYLQTIRVDYASRRMRNILFEKMVNNTTKGVKNILL